MAIGEIFKTANDRLKSPFLSSFIFSWVAFNWKAIFVVLAGKENVYTRINSIESVYLDTYSAFWYPFLVALFYTLVFPFVTVFFQRVTEQARIWSIKAKSERELLTARNEFKIEQTKAGTDDLKELNDQIIKLKEDLKKERSKNGTLNEKVNDFKKHQTQLEKDLEISQQDLNTTNTKLLNWVNLNKSGDSTIRDFYDIIEGGLYNSFKVIISMINSNKNTIIDSRDDAPESMDYFLKKELIDTIQIKSNKEPLIRFQLTIKGTDLKEFVEYYENIQSEPPS